MSKDAVNKSNKRKKSRSESKGKIKEVDSPQSTTTAAQLIKESIVVEVEDERESRKEKEKKKKKKEKREKKTLLSASPSNSEEVTDMDIQPQESSEDRKSKKRKRTDGGEAVETTEKERKKKKKKKDTEQPVQEVLEVNDKNHKPEATGDSSLAQEKRSKKERKKHKPSFSAELSAPSASTAGPLPSEAEAKSFLKKHNITISTPDDVHPVIPITTFSQLDIPDGLRIAFANFKEPSPIQACTWPPALEGRDVIGIAETGSGKTLAFGIPALSRLIKSTSKSSSKRSTISVLVVAPTRELAIQTHDTLSALGKPFGIASVAVFGGVPKEPQIQMLKNASKAKDGMVTKIVVGTPGRILDLMQEGTCDLGGVDYLVLDEADRMLDKGFENDIRNIISATRPMTERQTMMFSATWPEAVRRLASTFLRKPVRVTVGSDDLTANSRVEQVVEVFDDARSKDQRLLTALRLLSRTKDTKTSSGNPRVLVFALYKKEASRVEQMLRRQGLSVCALHGDMAQNARMEMLESFKDGSTNIMVATDVAARGLDIPDVCAVINYTFPLTLEDYVHRIGRTGRGGKSGKSITFFTGDNHERSLAGEFAKVLREGGFDYEALKKFPMAIKKREHSIYGAFYRDDVPVPTGPTKITF